MELMPEQRDLGMQVNNSLKVVSQVDRVMKVLGTQAFNTWELSMEVGMLCYYCTRCW